MYFNKTSFMVRKNNMFCLAVDFSTSLSIYLYSTGGYKSLSVTMAFYLVQHNRSEEENDSNYFSPSFFFSFYPSVYLTLSLYVSSSCPCLHCSFDATSIFFFSSSHQFFCYSSMDNTSSQLTYDKKRGRMMSCDDDTRIKRDQHIHIYIHARKKIEKAR